MKPRLPRKQKKQVNKQVAAIVAFRYSQCSLIAAMTMAQIAQISASPRPIDILPSANVALKSLRVAQVTSETVMQISKIMSEKPNTWRDFIK